MTDQRSAEDEWRSGNAAFMLHDPKPRSTVVGRAYVDPICPAHVSADSYRYVLSSSASRRERRASHASEKGLRGSAHAEAGELRGTARLLLPSRPHVGARRRPAKCASWH